MTWMASHRALGLETIVSSPGKFDSPKKACGSRRREQTSRSALIYRFDELFDLPEHPKIRTCTICDQEGPSHRHTPV